MPDDNEAKKQQDAQARKELARNVEDLLDQLGRLQLTAATWRDRLKVRGAKIEHMLKELQSLKESLSAETPPDPSTARLTIEEATVCYQGIVLENRFSRWVAPFMTGYLVLVVLGLGLALLWNYEVFNGRAAYAALYASLYSICGGALGGTASGARDFVYYIGKGLFDPEWCYSYLLRPLLGGVMGGVVYALLRAGLVVVSQGSTAGPSTEGYFALSFVAGFGVEQMARKLYDIGETAFAVTEKSKRTTT